jgi:dethiobiotin synthetase
MNGETFVAEVKGRVPQFGCTANWILKVDTVNGLLITGTDTDVGKTFVTALIARELVEQGVRPGVYKPACSGAVESAGALTWSDVESLAEASKIADRLLVCPQRFRAPLAPPVAARLEGRSVDEGLLLNGLREWESRSDYVLVEGVGGLLCPLSESLSVADFAAAVGFPLIIVARLGLGTLNHSLLTLEAARHRGLSVAGIVLSDGDRLAETPAGQTNAAELARRTSVPILGIVRFGAESLVDCKSGLPVLIDWQGLARPV